MTNPARLLAHHLAALNVPGSDTPEAVRARHLGVEEGGLGLWRAHGELMALVREVDSLLAGLNASGVRVEGYLPSLPYWYRAVLAVDTPWGTQLSHNRPALPDWAVNSLDNLGSTLDLINVAIDHSETDLAALRRALDDAVGVIDATTQLPLDTKRYLIALVTEARSALDDVERFGSSTPRKVTFALSGAMAAAVAGGKVPEDKKESWGAAVQGLIIGAGVSWLGPDGITAAADIIGRLTSG